MIAREEIGDGTTENMTYRKATGEGGKMGQKRREIQLSVGTMKGMKEERVYVTEGKSITGMLTARRVSKEKEP